MYQKQILSLVLSLLSVTLIAQELPIKAPNKVVNIDSSTLEKYTGFYKIEAMSLTLEITSNQGNLFAEVAGMGKIALQAGSQTAFIAKDLDAQLEFFDIQKQAQRIRLYQGGSVLEGMRIIPPKEPDYQPIDLGSNLIDYDKTYLPFESDWELEINGKKVGTATIDLRHASYNQQPSYAGGSVIRYESMGNKPFADRGFFSKVDYSPLQRRNAISQEEEITTTFNDGEATQITIHINTGEILSTKNVSFERPVFGAGIYQLLSMQLEKDMAVKFPVPGFNGMTWEKAQVAGQEMLKVEGFDKPFSTWRIEYSSGTIKWITDEVPYLVKWQMPTGMIWQLKNVND